MKNTVVGIVMGSDSDLPVVAKTGETLDKFGIAYEITIASAHRTPEVISEYAKNARSKGIKVIIAAAGGAAHLAGVIASLTPVPVIGIPIKAHSLEGLDSLLSIVQMPQGIPVATVAINGAVNAAILAAQIIGTSDKKIMKKVVDYKNNLGKKVKEKANKLKKIGVINYLKQMKK